MAALRNAFSLDSICWTASVVSTRNSSACQNCARRSGAPGYLRLGSSVRMLATLHGWHAPGVVYLTCRRCRSFRVRAGLEDEARIAAARDGLGLGKKLVYSPAMLEQLKLQMDGATLREDYQEAARIRDTMKMLLDNDPALRLKVLIEDAVVEERYEDAGKHLDELKRIVSTPKNEMKCYSDTTTQGIRVQVRSVYVSARSQPLKGQYFFAYHIRISNEGHRPVQLLTRHWIITDANGRADQSRGMGVIGQKPLILPGTNFEYTSACPLGTSTGKMEGDFEMRYNDEVTTLTFNVKVGLFTLSVNGDSQINQGCS